MKEQEEVTTTISLNKAMHKALRLLAVHKDTTVRELVRQAIDEYLKRQGGQKK